MENGNIEMSYNTERFTNEKTNNVTEYRTAYGVPENFNPADHPAVKMRYPTNSVDRSETQRKRRSKNRLSNRRSTGFVNPEMVEEALMLGPKGTTPSEEKV